MSALSSNLRMAVRDLLRAPGFTLTAVLTLALGIGANTAAFSLMKRLMLDVVPFPDADRLVMIHEEMPRLGLMASDLSVANYLDYRTNASHFESSTIWTNRRMNLSGDLEAMSLQVGLVTQSFLSTLGVRPVLGRDFQPSEDVFGGPRVAILGHNLWKTRFGGDPAIIGRTLRLDGRPHEVIGVMGEGVELPFTLPLHEMDLLVPAAWHPEQIENRGGHNWYGIARLEPGATVAMADQDLKRIMGVLAEQYPNVNAGRVGAAYPLRESATREIRQPMLLVMGVVALVLIIACTNVSNLLLARGLDRRREITIRSALGAARSDLIRQVMTESLLLGVLGGLAGLLVAKACLMTFPALLTFIPNPTPFSLDGGLLAFTLGVAVAAAILFGSIPAWLVTRLNPAEVLKDAAKGSGGREYHRIRSVLVVTEIAMAMALLVVTGLLLRSLENLGGLQPGFERAGLLTASGSRPRGKYADLAARRILFQRLAERVSAIPGVRSLALTDTLPLGDFSMNNGYNVDGQPTPKGTMWLALAPSVTPGYFRTMGIPLLVGRDFTDQDMDQPVGIVNEIIALKHWPGQDPLGKRIRFSGEWRTVVGVVKPVSVRKLVGPALGELYAPLPQANIFPYFSVALRTDGDPGKLIPSLKAAMREIDPDVGLFDIRTGDELFRRKLQTASTRGVLIGGFSILALALAAVGLYGVIGYLVRQRTREIGIRTALGAQSGQVIWEITRHGLILTALGLGIGVLGSLALGRLLASQLYQVSPADPSSMALGGLVLVSVALVATVIPALQAARVNPVVALRDE